MKCTNHGLERIKERTGLNPKKLLKRVKENGLYLSQIDNKKLKDYMFSIIKRDKLKVVKYYQGYIFIYARLTGVFITCFSLSEKEYLVN